MFQIDAGRGVAAALAALLLCACPGALLAQEQPRPEDPLDQPPLDPSAPLDPLPDLGVDWPDMDQAADAPIADTPSAAIADSAAERTYSVRIEGLDPDTQAAVTLQFDPLSALARSRKDPANAAQIDRRAREDSDLLAELLRARGFYDALVRTRVEGAAAGGEIVVTLEAEPGPLYRFAEVSLPGIEAAGEDMAALREAFGVAANEPVDAARVTTGEAALRVELGKRGYAFAEIGEMDIARDHETRTAALTLPVNPNGSRKFGRIVIEGRPLFSARHVQTVARWKPGAPYEAPLVEDLRRALIATGLVSSVAIRPVAGEGRSVDLAVSLERAPMRTIAGQAGYGTGEGIRVEASWQHRNLLPPEGAVTFRGVIGTQEQLIGAVLRRNNFLRRDQVLTAQVAISHIDRAAYDARTTILSGAIERQTNIIWQKKWTWSAGAELVATDERDVDIESGTTRRRTFFIGALPASLSYDGSNDLLDPSVGYRLAFRLSPEASLQSGTFGYARTQIDASLYQPFTPTVTLAGRVRLGTILGAQRDRIAPSRRFYAGGGGSVRGYGFQKLGPRDPVFDDPIGGRSVTEFAIEARIRFGNWGVVPFLDGGNISTSPLPKFDNLRFGAGLGVRYHTRFGPIRVDVGTPLNPRSGDSRVAVYVSLGQAF
ncbi:MAG TPA: BamA/TamA family outer membrane protein [Allosphingosinicella sp.]|jgi:translocation and assembly module TamA